MGCLATSEMFYVYLSHLLHFAKSHRVRLQRGDTDDIISSITFCFG